MFLARIVFFRLHESPRYLVHAGRHQEALESLQLISRFNGSDITLDLGDVVDRRPHEPRPPSSGSDEREPFLPSTQETRPDRETNGNAASNGPSDDARTRDEGVKDYQSTDDSPTSLDSHSFVTPVDEYPPRRLSVVTIGDTPSSSRPGALDDETKLPHARYHSPRSRASRPSSIASVELEIRFGKVLPRWIKRPLMAWLDRVGTVLSPEWCRTTLLVWAIWFFMSLGTSQDKHVDHVTKRSHQRTRCSTCTIRNCWRRDLEGIQPRSRWKKTYGTWLFLRWVDVQAHSYVTSSLLVTHELTDVYSLGRTWSKAHSADGKRWQPRPFRQPSSAWRSSSYRIRFSSA